MTAPATDKAPEDQRRQDGQSKEDESRVDRPTLERVHGLRRFDGRNRLAHDPPLNDVRNHQQIEKDERRRAPAAGF